MTSIVGLFLILIAIRMVIPGNALSDTLNGENK